MIYVVKYNAQFELYIFRKPIIKYMELINKKIHFFSILIILIILIIPSFMLIFWNSKLSDEAYYTGFLQSDQLVYTGLFRSVVERGNGIFYSYPYSPPGDDNPAVYFQLPFTLLASIWTLTNNLVISWEIYRYIFGFIFLYFVLIFLNDIFKIFFKETEFKPHSQYYLLTIFIILISGGGLAWIVSLLKVSFSADASSAGLIETFKKVEGNYHWWFLNLFRNIFYPLETGYHAFFFLSLIGITRKRYFLIASGHILACINGVFVGAELSMILIAYFFIEFIIRRTKYNFLNLLSAVIIFAAFFSYYQYYLGSFPIGKDLVSRLKVTIYDIIPVIENIYGYGILLLTTPFVFFNKDFRNRIFKTEHGRLLFIWLIVVFALIQNDKFLPTGKNIQPPHFTRGYFFSILVIISALGLFPFWTKLYTRKVKTSFFTLVLAVLFFIPDNILFVSERFTDIPHPNVLTISKETKSALDFLNNLNKQKVTFSPDRNFADLVISHTPHCTIFGQLYPTPFNDEKTAMIEKFFRNENVEEFVNKYHIDLIILPKTYMAPFERIVKRNSWVNIYHNSQWVIYDLYSRQ